MAVTTTSNKRPFRVDGVSTEAYLVKMVFTGAESAPFVDADLTTDNAHVIYSTLDPATNVTISDASPGVQVAVSAADTVFLQIVKNPVLE